MKEAQASYLCKQGESYSVASQDYDCLLFETPLLIQNLTLARKRKTISGYVEVKPQLIELKKVLNELDINQEQLITIGVLSGTDYNPGGILGIGPKKALKLVKEHKTAEAVFKFLENDEKFKDKIWFDWREIFELMKNPNVEKNCKIEFPKMDLGKIKEILMEHEFSEERINNQLEKLENLKEKQKQKTLF